MKTLLKLMTLVVFLSVTTPASANKRDAAFTSWIDADAECSRAYDDWLAAKVAEEAAIAQENAAMADWKEAKLRRDAAYAEWQKRSETPERLRK